jgi:hypothetical protein
MGESVQISGKPTERLIIASWESIKIVEQIHFWTTTSIS